MAEKMANAIATTGSQRNGSSTPLTTEPTENGSLQETPEPIANDGEDAKKAIRAMKREQRKAQRDPAMVIDALREVVRIAMANDLIGMALGMVKSAKNGNTIAMKILVDLCNIVNPDAGEDGSGPGITASELFSADLEGKYLLESENPATSEPAEAGIDVGANVGPNVGIDAVLTGKTL